MLKKITIAAAVSATLLCGIAGVASAQESSVSGDVTVGSKSGAGTHFDAKHENDQNVNGLINLGAVHG